MRNVFGILCLATLALAQTKPRARDLGVHFDGTPGPLNAITDVAGVEVGHSTIIRGEGKLDVGKGPVRTGVTVVLPRGKKNLNPVFAAAYSLNGEGEMTGTLRIEEFGILETAVFLTNTVSVGTVRDAAIAWRLKQGPPDDEGYSWSVPVVAETWDGDLNDANGFHVKFEHVAEALNGARSGPVAEGNVGGGTGMDCFGFKCGIGTASRKLGAKSGGYTVGVLVQANFGSRRNLAIAGVPVGKEIPEPQPLTGSTQTFDSDSGSILVVVATDAPLLPHQLKRLLRRVPMGLARTGSIGGSGSGDLFLAFSTAHASPNTEAEVKQIPTFPLGAMNPLFAATIEATEEAIINALVAAETMTGIDNREVIALPHDRLRETLKKYNRLAH